MHGDFDFRIHVPADLKRCAILGAVLPRARQERLHQQRARLTVAMQARHRPMAELVITRGLWLQDPRASRHAALAVGERYVLVHGGDAYTSNVPG